MNGFEMFAKFLPFVHAVELQTMFYARDVTNSLVPFLVLGGYTILSSVLATVLFLRQMKKR